MKWNGTENAAFDVRDEEFTKGDCLKVLYTDSFPSG
jgi:hypothetical protein